MTGHDDGEGASKRGATCLPKKVLVKVTKPLVLLPPEILKHFLFHCVPLPLYIKSQTLYSPLLSTLFHHSLTAAFTVCIYQYFLLLPPFMMMLTLLLLNTTSLLNTHNNVSDERLTAGASLLQSHIFYLNIDFSIYGSQKF